jgi:hypothetical protein
MSSFGAKSQDTLRISLSEFSIKFRDSLRLCEIIDARENKNTIGIFRLGSNNQKSPATFASPGLQEIEELFKRSSLITPDAKYLMRIRRLDLSEGAENGKELIRVEFHADFFYRLGGVYYYIDETWSKSSSTNASYAQIIADHVSNSLRFFPFSDRKPHFGKPFTKGELGDPGLSVR